MYDVHALSTCIQIKGYEGEALLSKGDTHEEPQVQTPPHTPTLNINAATCKVSVCISSKVKLMHVEALKC